MEKPTQQAWDDLSSAIAAAPPDDFKALADDELHTLSRLINDAHRSQQQQLMAALENALGYVPRLARGAVRKILFPQKGG